MIITRTPFRVSFAGGGSDLREFYSKNGFGAVVSMAINKYMYIVIHPYFHDKIRLKYSKTEDVCSVDQIEHPLIREALRKVHIERGIEIASFADVPAGTGLGSSSAFTVGLLNALYTFKGQVVSKAELAREACEIEISILGAPIGKQDQYAVAFGNINHIQFQSDETVSITPIVLTQGLRERLEERLCLYHVGGNRSAGDILAEQKKNLLDPERFRIAQKMVGLAGELRTIMEAGDLEAVGRILHEGWLLKKRLASGISNGAIDKLYEEFRRYNAKGGKLLGAGGTGFLLIYSEDHAYLQKYMGLRVLPFQMDREGTKAIYYE
ncbi:MAG: D-glycero-alpha-D-manno-heptose 7-phosphate kinase [Thermodesulfobacteriota bacterium]|nr:D-glycero-alpha-D-manno-heptose 7-phosphate kinase [Thermodesulfobacteriota bacterium]